MAGTAGSTEIITVTGPIAPETAGLILPHEHIYARLWEPPQVATVARGGAFGEVHIEEDTIVQELQMFKNAGGGTLVDLTTRGIGRNPERTKALSMRSGVNIILGCGWYREPYYPPEDLIDQRSADDLASDLISEFTDGIEGTDIRPGIIGEIGVNTSWMTGLEERVHRAVARAQLATGLAITTHSAWTPIGLRQLEVFCEEGVDPARVAIGHADSYPVYEYYCEVLDAGAYLQFDNIGQFDIPGYQDRVTRLILRLLEAGYSSQILLSQDVWNVKQFAFAGGTGYGGLISQYLPYLRELGVDSSTIVELTQTNPRNLLARQAS